MFRCYSPPIRALSARWRAAGSTQRRATDRRRGRGSLHPAGYPFFSAPFPPTGDETPSRRGRVEGYLLSPSYSTALGENVNGTHLPAGPIRYDGIAGGKAMVRAHPARRRRRWGRSPRRMAVRWRPAERRPACDAAYRKVAGEFLRKLSLEDDDGLTTAVARRFKEAPAKLCCRAIGGWIDRRLLGLGWTQHDLADRIGVDRSAVAKWTTGGAISLGTSSWSCSSPAATSPTSAPGPTGARPGGLPRGPVTRPGADPSRGGLGAHRPRALLVPLSPALRALLGAGRPARRTGSSSRGRRTGFSGGPASRSAPGPSGSSGSRA